MRRKLLIVVTVVMTAACAGEAVPDTTASSETTATSETTPTSETTAASTPAAAPDTTAAPETTTSTTAPATTAPAATAPAATAPAATITISGFNFGEPVTIAAGETVEVVNEDAVGHTWTSRDDVFDSGVMGQGFNFRFRFDEAGEYPFFCAIHSAMQGTVTVEG